jgi:hypothetical protein
MPAEWLTTVWRVSPRCTTSARCLSHRSRRRTDEGLRAAEVHVHEIHATILFLLGFNHRRLTFRHNGRSERLTDNAGEVIEAMLA